MTDPGLGMQGAQVPGCPAGGAGSQGQCGLEARAPLLAGEGSAPRLAAHRVPPARSVQLGTAPVACGAEVTGSGAECAVPGTVEMKNADSWGPS